MFDRLLDTFNCVLVDSSHFKIQSLKSGGHHHSCSVHKTPVIKIRHCHHYYYYSCWKNSNLSVLINSLMSITIWCRIKREEKRARRLKAVTALEAWTRRPKKGAKGNERERRAAAAAAFSFTLDGPSRDSQDIWDRLNVLLGESPSSSSIAASWYTARLCRPHTNILFLQGI